jgi:L-aspartate oxidase
MGGVETDLHARTSLENLFAAGEVACTGVHGANRLASNSLLEGIVFGARAAQAMRNQSRADSMRDRSNSQSPAAPQASKGVEREIARIRELMWNNVGVVRSGESLRHAITDLEKMTSELPAASSRRACEAHNLRDVALLIARSALAREESRGAHYRTDFPAHNDARFKTHSVVKGSTVAFR